MNNFRRETLSRALELLGQADEIVLSALEQEQSCLENMPENLEYSEKCEKMEDAVGLLEEASEYISDVKSKIEDAMI